MDDLAAARRREGDLRRRLAGLVAERSRAEQDVVRLDERALLAGADPRMGEAAGVHRLRLGELATEIETARADLRLAEGLVAELEARG